MSFTVPITSQSLGAGRARVVRSMSRTPGLRWGRQRRVWRCGARLIATALVLSAIGSGGACRSSPQGDSSIAQERQPYHAALPVTHADAVLATEAGHMANEDQRRAVQAYDHMREKRYPHRDYPIKPVIPP